MIVAGYILLAMLTLRFLVVLINFACRPFLPEEKKPENTLLVSVLIPARNEEANLPLLLSDLQQSDYHNFEVIVCDDHSSDRTSEILHERKAAFSRLSYFRSEQLPEGWKGKNFACHQLAMKARGDYFLFLDADVRVTPSFLSRVVTFTSCKKLSLLTMFPLQTLVTRGEWITVPMMNWILLSFLPLPLVRLKWFPSLSAANGQMMMFEGNGYRVKGWHQLLKNETVEDISIARTMKKKGYPIAVLLGKNDISCRMYSGYDEAVKGFSRNVHQYFGSSRAWLIFYNFVAWTRIPFLLLVFPPHLAMGALLLILVMKVLISEMSHQKTLKNIVLHVNQLLSFTLISLRNIRNKIKGEVEWKGRTYSS